MTVTYALLFNFLLSFIKENFQIFRIRNCFNLFSLYINFESQSTSLLIPSFIKLMSQSHKNIQLIKSLKQCIEQVLLSRLQTLLLCKACNFVPKALQNPKDVIEYSQSLLKILKNLVDFLPKNMTSIQTFNKLKGEHEELNSQHSRVMKENKQYKCELDVVNIRLADLEAKEMKLIEEKTKEKKYSVDFQTKLNQIKKDSEQGLKKIIETSKSKEMKTYQKTRSLPTIHTYANREKLGLLLLMSEPLHKPPKRKSLIQAFKI